MDAFVLDTNVLVVANDRAKDRRPNADEKDWRCCVEKSQDCLAQAKEGRVLIDEGGLIWEEYACYCNYSGQPGLGDVFFLWLYERKADVRHCISVSITPDPDKGFTEFPDDPQLTAFDKGDRKFVAVALAYSGDAVIYNTVDSDWWIHRKALAANGVRVEHLCPSLLKQA